MKAVAIKNIKDELKHKNTGELIELCLRLSKFKKENKELLTYLLFESENEEKYIDTVKNEIDEQFELINTKTYYFIKKSVRKILRNTKKYIRYSKNKETEIYLLLYFCKKLKQMSPNMHGNTVLLNIFNRELNAVSKKVMLLHDDLQYDFGLIITQLQS